MCSSKFISIKRQLLRFWLYYGYKYLYLWVLYQLLSLLKTTLKYIIKLIQLKAGHIC